MIKFAEDCNDVDITMDANFLDNIAKTLNENEYLPRMKRFAFQMQPTLRKARRNFEFHRIKLINMLKIMIMMTARKKMFLMQMNILDML